MSLLLVRLCSPCPQMGLLKRIGRQREGERKNGCSKHIIRRCFQPSEPTLNFSVTTSVCFAAVVTVDVSLCLVSVTCNYEVKTPDRHSFSPHRSFYSEEHSSNLLPLKVVFCFFTFDCLQTWPWVVLWHYWAISFIHSFQQTAALQLCFKQAHKVLEIHS